LVVLSNLPGWWTPTAKAKVVAGIALALRFAHGLGLLYGALKASYPFHLSPPETSVGFPESGMCRTDRYLEKSIVLSMPVPHITDTNHNLLCIVGLKT
jgi:hypothetical protein